MSIMTKTGDDGLTSLMFRRRVPKNHPRVEACGGVDELSAALGLARAGAGRGELSELLAGIQAELIQLMGELATLPEDSVIFREAGFRQIGPQEVGRLEERAQRLEQELEPARGWILPGPPTTAAALHLARAVCRRAERNVAAIPLGELNPQILIYLNRLSDLLWLLARRAETA